MKWYRYNKRETEEDVGRRVMDDGQGSAVRKEDTKLKTKVPELCKGKPTRVKWHRYIKRGPEEALEEKYWKRKCRKEGREKKGN